MKRMVTMNMMKGTKTIPQLPATKTAATSTIFEASCSLDLKQHMRRKMRKAKTKQMTA